MIEKFKIWLQELKGSKASIHSTSARQRPPRRQANPRVKSDSISEEKPVETPSAGDLNGRIESLGPGKNVLIRNKYVREDTGTHETLKIIDEDSLINTGEETGIDPYNTGGFDRSKNWDTRFRK